MCSRTNKTRKQTKDTHTHTQTGRKAQADVLPLLIFAQLQSPSLAPSFALAMPTFAFTNTRKSCCHCCKCSGRPNAAGQAIVASATPDLLTRALDAEAEVRRLRALCSAMHALSKSPPCRDQQRQKKGRSRSRTGTMDRACKCQRLSATDARSGIQASTVVNCSDILYTQDSCKNVFSDGTTLEEVVQQLTAKLRDPLHDPFFILDVVDWDGRLFSVDNRRLYCLRQYQERLGESRVVQVRIRLHRWLDVLDRFWYHFTTVNGGTAIRVRS